MGLRFLLAGTWVLVVQHIDPATPWWQELVLGGFGWIAFGPVAKHYTSPCSCRETDDGA